MIMLLVYIGSIRDPLISQKMNQNFTEARLIQREKVDFARHQHDRNLIK